MPLNMKNINNFTQWNKWIRQCDGHPGDHASKAPQRSLGAVRIVH